MLLELDTTSPFLLTKVVRKFKMMSVKFQKQIRDRNWICEFVQIKVFSPLLEKFFNIQPFWCYNIQSSDIVMCFNESFQGPLRSFQPL